MAKELSFDPGFTEVPDYDELVVEEARISVRRLSTYSREALKIGIFIDRIFIRYSTFNETLKGFDRAFQLAREMSAPQGFRLVGPTGSGKTALYKYFRESLPRSSLYAPGVGCIGMAVNKIPTAAQIIASILRTYRYPLFKYSERRIYQLKDLATELVVQKGTRLIYFDSAHHFLSQVSRRVNDTGEPSACSYIGELMDEARVAVVLGGGAALDRLESVAPALADRVVGRYQLAYFPADDKEWVSLLATYVRDAAVVFDIGIILTKGHPKLLHMATNGNLRHVKRLLTEGVLVAAQSGAKQMLPEHLKSAFHLVNGPAASRTNPYV